VLLFLQARGLLLCTSLAFCIFTPPDSFPSHLRFCSPSGENDSFLKTLPLTELYFRALDLPLDEEARAVVQYGLQYVLSLSHRE
jgi:hypothetical protein